MLTRIARIQASYNIEKYPIDKHFFNQMQHEDGLTPLHFAEAFSEELSPISGSGNQVGRMKFSPGGLFKMGRQATLFILPLTLPLPSPTQAE